MKILLVVNSLILAGGEALTKDLALEFQRKGHTVEVAVFKRLGSAFERHLEDSGIQIFIPARGGIYSPFHAFALSRRIAQFDVAIAVLFPSSLWMALAARLTTRPPILIASEQSTHNRRRRHKSLRFLDRWMYSVYDALPCASAAIQKSLIAWLPSLAKKTMVIPNAINLQRFASADAYKKEDFNSAPGRPILIFTARFEAQKDHPTLLRALASVPEAQLLLLGDGPLRPKIERMAVELSIFDRVKFLGRRADVAELLKTADLYIHSAHFEGFGIAAVEAMAAGLPVIAGDVPGLNEVVADAGLLFPAGDHEALARQIKAVLASPELRAELAQKSQQRAQEYSIESCASRFLALCE